MEKLEKLTSFCLLEKVGWIKNTVSWAEEIVQGLIKALLLYVTAQLLSLAPQRVSRAHPEVIPEHKALSTVESGSKTKTKKQKPDLVSVGP